MKEVQSDNRRKRRDKEKRKRLSRRRASRGFCLLKKRNKLFLMWRVRYRRKDTGKR